MAGYLPTNDGQFSEWVQQFLTYVTAHEVELGITAVQVAVLGGLQTEWNNAYAAHTIARTTAKSCTADKNAKRKAMEDGLRPIVAFIQGRAETSDAEREAMGLGTGGGATPSDVELSDERPLPIIDISARLKHVLRVQTVTPTGTKKARPQGMIGAELWRKIGEQPSGVQDMEYVGIVKKTPHMLEYSDSEAGKMAHYALRWINTKGEPGSWSETESATIAA